MDKSFTRGAYRQQILGSGPRSPTTYAMPKAQALLERYREAARGEERAPG
jgi:hypothetical protein